MLSESSTPYANYRKYLIKILNYLAHSQQAQQTNRNCKLNKFKVIVPCVGVVGGNKSPPTHRKTVHNTGSKVGNGRRIRIGVCVQWHDFK